MDCQEDRYIDTQTDKLSDTKFRKPDLLSEIKRIKSMFSQKKSQNQLREDIITIKPNTQREQDPKRRQGQVNFIRQ